MPVRIHVSVFASDTEAIATRREPCTCNRFTEMQPVNMDRR